MIIMTYEKNLKIRHVPYKYIFDALPKKKKYLVSFHIYIIHYTQRRSQGGAMGAAPPLTDSARILKIN